MSKVYMVSDTHFGHAKIITLCSRPYKNIEAMNKDLILRWNNTVAKDDIVFHLGDFGFGDKRRIAEIVRALNGRIVLCLGNHDGHGIKWHYDVGFYNVYKYPIVYAREYLLSHAPFFPLEDFNDGKTPFINIFGHIHNRTTIPTFGPSHACISIENIDYRPMTFEEIANNIKNAKAKSS